MSRVVVVAAVLQLAVLPQEADASVKRGDFVVMPAAESSAVQARGPRTVWLDFEGGMLTTSATVDDARSDTSFILSEGHSPGTVVTVPAFDLATLSDAQSMTRAQILVFVKAEMESIHAPYDIFFTRTRPASGNYQRLIFGGTCPTISGGSTCAGTAVRNCLDTNLNNIGFAHPVGLSVDQLISTAAQEMAHAYGLNHTEDTSDIMFPSLQAGVTPRSYGSGTVPVTETACGGEVAQDSHALLLSIIGARGQDVTVPLVSIDSPSGNGLDLDGDLTVSVTASDDEELSSVDCSVDGTSAGPLASGPFDFVFTALAVGSHALQCVATDASGNTAADSLLFFVGECVTSGDCSGELVCQDNLCVTPPPPSAEGVLGDSCSQNSDCISDQCVTEGAFSLCSRDCASDAACPIGFECRAGANVCWPRSSGGSGANGDGGDGGPFGCFASSVAADGRTTGGSIVLLGLLLLALRRRSQL